jgi:hypothetical protein
MEDPGSVACFVTGRGAALGTAGTTQIVVSPQKVHVAVACLPGQQI